VPTISIPQSAAEFTPAWLDEMFAQQIGGLQREQVIATVEQIARLHARYWNNDALAELDWMALVVVSPIRRPRRVRNRLGRKQRMVWR
jgi:hypothetical protein